jgi:cytochrome P450
MKVITEILGIPAADYPRLLRWSEILTSGTSGAEDDVANTLTTMRRFLRELVSEPRHRRAATGLLDVLAEACHREGQLDEAELLSTAFQLLQGGHVTTLGLIANGILAILHDPTQLAALRGDPALVDLAVDELLRFDAPMGVATVRFTTREMRIGDVTIPGAGEPVILALAAAHRDPRKFADPDDIDFGRDRGSAGIPPDAPDVSARMLVRIAVAILTLRSEVDWSC